MYMLTRTIGTHLYIDTNYREAFKFSWTIGTHLNCSQLSGHLFKCDELSKKMSGHILRGQFHRDTFYEVSSIGTHPRSCELSGHIRTPLCIKSSWRTCLSLVANIGKKLDPLPGSWELLLFKCITWYSCQHCGLSRTRAAHVMCLASMSFVMMRPYV